MFIAFGVEGNDATVIEIKGNCNTRIMLDAVPIVRMTVDILKDHHRLIVALLKQTVVISLDRHKSHIDIYGLIHYDCLTATSLKIVTIAQPVYNGDRLSLIDQSEVKLSQFSSKAVITLPQLLIGIVWPRLIDDVTLKAIVSGRLDTETSAVTNATEPNECL